jgi:hypothetical protein
MQKRWHELFFRLSCALVLTLTALLKLLTVAVDSDQLQAADPVLAFFPGWLLITITAVIELGVASYLIFGRVVQNQIKAIAWLSTAFVLYRAGLMAVGYSAPCTCLGLALSWVTFAKMWHLDLALKIFLAYMFTISWGMLLLSGASRPRCWVGTPPRVGT